jgi:hypothetical protein
MQIRLPLIIGALLVFAVSAEAQNCNGAQAALLRKAVIVCTRGSAPAGGGRRLPANCEVEQTAPVCRAGLTTLLVTDITGRWRQGPSTMILTADVGHRLTGSMKDNFRVLHITGGVFDAASRTINIQFSAPGKKQYGSAALRVSADEGTLTGTWQLPTVGRGTWTFTR